MSAPGHPHQQLIDKHVAQPALRFRLNPLDTRIALVEAEEGIAVISSFGWRSFR
jgi:hypothetical protein